MADKYIRQMRRFDEESINEMFWRNFQSGTEKMALLPRNFPATFSQQGKLHLCFYTCFRHGVNFKWLWTTSRFVLWIQGFQSEWRTGCVTPGPNQTERANGRINLSSKSLRLRPWKDTSVRDVIWYICIKQVASFGKCTAKDIVSLWKWQQMEEGRLFFFNATPL